MAIVAVVGFHANIAWLSGGFVGVDVFFVISGYLITRTLWEESRSRGSVSLLSFWAKRVRRLVPAMALMIAVVLPLSYLVFLPLSWQYITEQALSATLYVSNIYFGARSDQYFADDATTSVFLHTWSLGIEEQFYLAWPVIVLCVTILARRLRLQTPRVPLLVSFALIAAASFTASLVLSMRGTPWAFYSLPTRAWELAAGAILGILITTRHLRLGRATGALGVSSFALLLWCIVAFDSSGPYPGIRALAPVGAAVGLILAGSSTYRHWLIRGFESRPMQWTGRVSYSWYLWHWPAMLLAAQWLERDSTAVRVGAGVFSLVIAAATFHWFENPVRFSARLAGSLRSTYLFGALLTASVVGLCATLLVYRSTVVSHEPYRSVEIALADAADVFRPERCANSTQTAGFSVCEMGDPNGAATVILYGDSHAAQWAEAIGEVGEELGVRVLLRSRGYCPTVAVRLDGANFRGCASFRGDTWRLIEGVRPDAVILSHWNGTVKQIVDEDGRPAPSTLRMDEWADAYEELLLGLESMGVQPISIIDNPMAPFDPLRCISSRRSPDDCTFSLDDDPLEIRRVQAIEREIADRFGVPIISSTEDICADGTCATMIDGVVVYWDPGHLTSAFTKTLRQQIETALRSAISPSRLR